MNEVSAVSNLCVGDVVEVRSKEEILRTLDRDGRLDGLPFMPEMLPWCGKRFRVFRRAHKTCDTIDNSGGRRMAGAVHLEDLDNGNSAQLRCDGAAHGECQAGCLIFWKEAWLRPAGHETDVEVTNVSGSGRLTNEEDVWRSAATSEADPTYSCQTTCLLDATSPLKWSNPGQYWEDYKSGNVGIRRMLMSFLFSVYNHLINAGVGLGVPLRWLYDRIQSLTGGVPYPHRPGLVPTGESTPTGVLNLQPGELVRVKDYKAIRATLDCSSKNRGLYFDCEEVPFCGKTYKVIRKVDRIINEKTGKMMRFKATTVFLDGVWCQARFSEKRLFCPRAIYPMWREVWLERVVDQPASKK